MTDNEIIKALEVISTTSNCHECAFYSGKVCNCSQVTAIQALDLINRQQAEIKRLQTHIEVKNRKFDSLFAITCGIRDKTIKEFTDKVRRKSQLMASSVYAEPERAVFISDIDEIVKEMTGKENKNA